MNCFVMIMGATVFGYIVANVGNLMGGLNRTQAIIQEKISDVTEYLSEKQVPKALSGSILRHYKQMMKHTSAYDESAILARLPTNLRNEILMITNQETFTKIPLFKYIQNSSVLLYVYRLMDPAYFDKDHYIIREGDFSVGIFFMCIGKAIVFKAKNFRAFVNRRGVENAKKKQETLEELEHMHSKKQGNIPIRKIVGFMSSIKETVTTRPSSAELKRRPKSAERFSLHYCLNILTKY